MNGITKQKATEVIEKSLAMVSEIASKPRKDEAVIQWKFETKARLCNLFGEKSRQVQEFDHTFRYMGFGVETEEQSQQEHVKNMGKARALLNALKTEIDDFWVTI